MELCQGPASRLREDLDATEIGTLDSFIFARRKEEIYILRAGELEDYLPAHGSGLGNLIELLDRPDWECAVPLAQRHELIEIASAALGLPREAIDELKMQYMDVPFE